MGESKQHILTGIFGLCFFSYSATVWLKGTKILSESHVAINEVLHALALRPSDFESRQDPYLSVAANPALFRQKDTRAHETLDITVGLSREHCLGSAGAATFPRSADMPLHELRHPLSEYGNARMSAFGCDFNRSMQHIH